MRLRRGDYREFYDSKFEEYLIFPDKKCVGVVQFTNRNDRIFIRQLYIDPKHRRKGYAREVIQKLAAYQPQLSYRIPVNDDVETKFWKQMEKELSEQGYVIENIDEVVYKVNNPNPGRII